MLHYRNFTDYFGEIVEGISLHTLFIILLSLLLISSFFASAEIAIMSINRYRLKHLTRKKHKAALRVSKLLERPDRLLSVILVGSTITNTLAPVVVTLLGVRLMGATGLIVGPLLLTLVLLIFAEIAPKTLAALYPEPVAFFSSWPLTILLKILLPIVWFATYLANGLLRLFGLKMDQVKTEHLSREELLTVVREAGSFIPNEHKKMLLSLLELELVTVNDIMVPVNEIVGIDIKAPWEEIIELLESSQHTRLPLYEDTIENVLGIVHMRKVLNLLANNKLTKESLKNSAHECSFIPDGTQLHHQLLNFKKEKNRIGIVVDEYGDIQGLVTLEDILEEIIGEFTTVRALATKEIVPQTDSSFLVDGGALLRDLNRSMHWKLPVSGPKTLNGLIIETLEFIPPVGTCLKIAGYPIEIIKIKENIVKVAKIFPRVVTPATPP